MKILVIMVFLMGGIRLWADSVSLKYAKRFSIEKRGDHHLIEINNPWPGSKIVQRYLAVPRKQKLPDNPEGLKVIRTPLKRVVTQATTMLPYFIMLNEIEKIVGVDQFSYINSPEVLKRVKAGKIREVGSSTQINIERILHLQPDLVMTYGTTMTKYNNHPKLEKAGIPYLLMASYMEDSLLGRVEWIKFFGVLFEKTQRAESEFKRLDALYLAEKKKALHYKSSPTVFCNAPFGGIWHMPSGHSWVARLIADAGGDYLWKKDHSQSGSLQLSMESVMLKALNADYWLNPTHLRWKNYADVSKTDTRYTNFKAYKERKIFTNDKRVNAKGGNDIFESGLMNPHLILRDLISIFHTKKHENLTYHRPLSK